MAANPPDKPKSGGLSLFASLLDPSAKNSIGTITKAPVVFKQPSEDDVKEQETAAPEKTQLNAAALRFQPTKRPQLSAQKEKAQRVAQAQAKAAAVAAALVSGIKKVPSETAAEAQSVAPRTTVADWTNDAEDDDFYAGSKKPRGGRKKRKKNKQDQPVAQDWDDIYDPSRPNNYEEYKHSDERVREIREWKDKLYAHRRRERASSDSSSDDGVHRPQMSSMLVGLGDFYANTMQDRFAPPSMAFAPPSFDVPPPPPADTHGQDIPDNQIQPPPPPPPDDQTGEDAYTRRMRLSQQPPPPSAPIPPSSSSTRTERGTISRAPVRYSLPEAPAELPRSEAELEEALQEESQSVEAEDAPRSNRPGQKGFAERLMNKYGWTKGSGLGADGSGIINPLRVQVEKQKKRPDAEGGGVIGPASRGKIIGGKKKDGAEAEHGKFGPMSEVVILRGMLDGMDLDFELGEGNLMQEIGEECGEKYGRVERVYVDRNQTQSTPVFIKFTNQLSALRAVNALEGRIFNGNKITARFFDSDDFAKGVYTQDN